ncbi:Hypothetical_protein [Hexamita inflata]|uniref:Hypothetical_protein n=1 Tax=Hexamita inflata TaxID=28002 RepID=A0AA86PV17_9EUKA|nr:Hypothetical protein HINF_LOCUS29545 [Hexamita inflata]
MTHSTATIQQYIQTQQIYIRYFGKQKQYKYNNNKNKQYKNIGKRDRQASRVWEQGKKAKPKATLDRTSSEQPSRIEDLEHERVRKNQLIQKQYNINNPFNQKLTKVNVFDLFRDQLEQFHQFNANLPLIKEEELNVERFQLIRTQTKSISINFYTSFLNYHFQPPYKRNTVVSEPTLILTNVYVITINTNKQIQINTINTKGQKKQQNRKETLLNIELIYSQNQYKKQF